MKLHVFPPSPRAAKVTSLADHLGLAYETCLVDLFKGEQRSPGFAALNANQRMPVLEDGDFVLWESNAILAYLASKKPESGMWPSDARAQADALRWMTWEAAHWMPACAILAFQRVVKKMAGQGDADPVEVEKGLADFQRLAPVLDGHLRSRKWMLGDRLTVADFCIAGSLAMAEVAQFPLDGYGAITDWYRRFGELPAWKRALVPPMS
jgi:glutathione S-transferase